jgi:hypothetical protein
MNDYDRNNLEFLLNADDATIKDWHSKVSADDIDYAHELLDAFSKELKERAQALKVEAEMTLQGNYPEANQVIDRIRKL